MDRCPNCGVHLDPAKRKKEVEVPVDLVGLALYANDPALCMMWPSLMASWVRTYPRGREWILEQVALAHSWEVANPENRKRQRGRFLNTWLSRGQDRHWRGSGGVRKKPWTDAWDEFEELKKSDNT